MCKSDGASTLVTGKYNKTDKVSGRFRSAKPTIYKLIIILTLVELITCGLGNFINFHTHYHYSLCLCIQEDILF